ncbi:MAG: GNAT family N-acetyltransferase [Pseudomonadota bacterium]
MDALFRVHQASVRGLCSAAYSARHIDTWFEGRTPEIYLPLLERGQILVALLEGRIQGFVGALPGEVTSLFVLPEAAGHGLGSKLFMRGLARAEAAFDGPITVISTRNAVDFYARFGFEPVEEGTFVRGQGQLEYPVVKMVRSATRRDNAVPALGDPPCV